MGIYGVDGSVLLTAYDKSGSALLNAYDVNGQSIFQPVPPENILKVMTYNVGGWYNGTGVSVPSTYDNLYYDLQNGIISRNDPDILCIEEYRGEFSTSGRTAVSMLSNYYQYIEAKYQDSNYLGRAICSKYPIKSYTEHNWSNDSEKYYDTAVITINGVDVSVIVLHTSTDQTLRKAQGKELFDYVQTLDCFIACGDYNTTYADSTSGQEYTDFYLQFVNAGYNLANCSEQNGFHYTYFSSTSQLWRCLDNEITSADLQIISVVVDQTKVTNPITTDPNWKIDHLPLVVQMLKPT